MDRNEDDCKVNRAKMLTEELAAALPEMLVSLALRGGPHVELPLEKDRQLLADEIVTFFEAELDCEVES